MCIFPGARAQRKRQQMESLIRYIALVIVDGDVCCDIGAGSGHLGLLMAYLWPKTRMVLVEPREISVSQCHERINSLGLTNVSVVHGLLDDFKELMKSNRCKQTETGSGCEVATRPTSQDIVNMHVQLAILHDALAKAVTPTIVQEARHDLESFMQELAQQDNHELLFKKATIWLALNAESGE